MGGIGNRIIFQRWNRTWHYVIDEVEVVTVDGLYYWARREGSGDTSAKIDFQSLADTLSFCGYVRMPPVP